MKRFATGTLLAFVVLALSWGLTASASALPEIHIALGESFPVEGEGVAKGENIAGWSTALSAPITAQEIRLLLKCEKLGSLCLYDKHYLATKIEGKECSTAGDAAGVVLVAKNELHFVSTSTAPLDLNADFLVAKTTISCKKGAEELKLTLEGEDPGKIEGVKDMEDVTTFRINLKCTKPNNGKQEVKEYLNDEGKLVKATLKLNLGLGNETGCEEVKEAITVKAIKMVEFLF